MPKLKQAKLPFVKIPALPVKEQKCKEEPNLKQATLSSLKGVVVVEDLQRRKNILDNPRESDEIILTTLNYLMQKRPCKEVIDSTGIALTMKKLEKHSNTEISQKAKELRKSWKPNDSTKCQPTVEVRYDNLTRHIRRKAVQLFCEALGGQEEDDKLADSVEREIFHKCERLISKTYRKNVRKIVFILRHQETKKNELKQGDVTFVQFVANNINLPQRRS
ncbi:hypothetical protein JTE90_001727 [Oedothorax gibbosus]|uniref:TFIIS N-terminal domain-containing protein n=1 Tax=Oedothorax gibbosus TaxID=931172 RepID=A0AAV6TXJ8_9ARAC|nr:hypothetical protein JTE90_001727 [Oedothorax gibbosus]